MTATRIYRTLIAIRGCWIFAEWLLGWGVYSHVSLFKLTHPYAHWLRMLLQSLFG